MSSMGGKERSWLSTSEGGRGCGFLRRWSTVRLPIHEIGKRIFGVELDGERILQRRREFAIGTDRARRLRGGRLSAAPIRRGCGRP